MSQSTQSANTKKIGLVLLVTFISMVVLLFSKTPILISGIGALILIEGCVLFTRGNAIQNISAAALCLGGIAGVIIGGYYLLVWQYKWAVQPKHWPEGMLYERTYLVLYLFFVFIFLLGVFSSVRNE